MVSWIFGLCQISQHDVTVRSVISVIIRSRSVGTPREKSRSEISSRLIDIIVSFTIASVRQFFTLELPSSSYGITDEPSSTLPLEDQSRPEQTLIQSFEPRRIHITPADPYTHI